MGKLSRTKGHSFERDIANRLKKWIYPDAKRHLEYQASEALSGIDLVNTGKLAIQCKAYKNYPPMSKIEEVDSSVGYPTLISKGDRLKPTITMYLEDFIEYVNEEIMKQR